MSSYWTYDIWRDEGVWRLEVFQNGISQGRWTLSRPTKRGRRKQAERQVRWVMRANLPRETFEYRP